MHSSVSGRCRWAHLQWSGTWQNLRRHLQETTKQPLSVAIVHLAWRWARACASDLQLDTLPTARLLERPLAAYGCNPHKYRFWDVTCLLTHVLVIGYANNRPGLRITLQFHVLKSGAISLPVSLHCRPLVCAAGS
jgi:hypothetical protein